MAFRLTRGWLNMLSEGAVAVLAAGAVASLGAGLLLLKTLSQSAQQIRRRIGHERVKVPMAGAVTADQAMGMAITLGVAALLYLLSSVLTHRSALSLAVAFGGFLVPGWVRQWRETKRLVLLSEQLGRVMAMVSTSLRRGTPLEVAITEAARSMPTPLGPVLRHLSDATVMGVTLSQAIEQARTLPAVAGSSDFNVFATEMVVCHVRGANVIQAFESLRNVLAARRKYREQVREHMGQHLLQSLVIGGLGFGVLSLYALMAPEGIQPLMESVIGQMLLAASVLGNIFLIRVTHLSLLSQTRRV